MSYANPEDQKKYHQKWYIRNRAKVLKRQLKINHEAAKRRRAYLNELKSSTPCTDCGMKYPSECMDFDHTEKNKSIGVAQSTNHSWKKMLSEVKKCEIVCSNCHRVRTQKRLKLESSILSSSTIRT